jgi:hypothetical protein
MEEVKDIDWMENRMKKVEEVKNEEWRTKNKEWRIKNEE